MTAVKSAVTKVKVFVALAAVLGVGMVFIDHRDQLLPAFTNAKPQVSADGGPGVNLTFYVSWTMIPPTNVRYRIGDNGAWIPAPDVGTVRGFPSWTSPEFPYNPSLSYTIQATQHRRDAVTNLLILIGKVPQSSIDNQNPPSVTFQAYLPAR